MRDFKNLFRATCNILTKKCVILQIKYLIMKKQIFATLVVVASLMLSCSAPQNVIIGNIEGLEKGDKVYLTIGSREPYVVVDSVVVESDGYFQIETLVTDVSACIYLAKKGTELNMANSRSDFFIEGFSTMNISGDINDFNYAKVTGGLYAMPEMAEHCRITDSALLIQQKGMKKYNENRAIINSSTISKDSIAILNKEFMDLLNQSNDIFRGRDSVDTNFRKNNPDVAYSANLLSSDYHEMEKGMESYEAVFNILTPRVQSSLEGKSLAKYIASKKATEVGANAPDFKAKDINGKDINLSDFKGKYLLLEFWGTWCGPCIMSIPHLVEMYDKIKGDNFELLSIASRENGEKNLLKMIKEKKMVWRHINDANGEINSTYGINSWPSCFLIDPQGVIIEVGHPMDLSKKVEEIILGSR